MEVLVEFPLAGILTEREARGAMPAKLVLPAPSAASEVLHHFQLPVGEARADFLIGHTLLPVGPAAAAAEVAIPELAVLPAADQAEQLGLLATAAQDA